MEVFRDFVSNRLFQRDGVFCVAFSASKRFFWAIKHSFWTIFQNFHHKGFRGGKNFRQGEDRVKNLKEKLFWNQHDKTNTKMGGRSLIDYGSPLLYCVTAPYCLNSRHSTVSSPPPAITWLSNTSCLPPCWNKRNLWTKFPKSESLKYL